MSNETLVIRINGFDNRICDGYTSPTQQIRDQVLRPVVLAKFIGAKAVGEFIAANPRVPVQIVKF